MHFTPTIAALLLGLTSLQVLAAPLPQLAGEGSACDSVLSDTDNGVGYGIENAENNVASTINSAKGTNGKRRRQLAGEGSACNSVLSSTDNGVGYGTENAENNIANNVNTAKGAAGKLRRQLDKIAKGAGNIGDALGTGQDTDPVADDLETVDGQLTGDASDVGAQVGGDEEATLEQAGSDVPKSRRQLDKIAKGAGNVADSVGAGSVGDPTATELEGLDGTLTSDAANAGQQIGSTEQSTLEQAGSNIPK